MDPDHSIIAWEIVGILACLVLSAFFSGSETALTSLSRSKADQLVEEEGQVWLKLWLTNPIRVLTTILIGNNIVNVASSALATDVTYRLLEGTGSESWSIPVAVGVMTLLLLTFGEITPKAISKRAHLKVSSMSMRVLRLLYYPLTPISYVFVQFTKFIVRIFGGDPDSPSPFVTYEEIEYLVELGTREGTFKENHELLLKSVVDFPDRVVKEVMIPRTDMVTVDISDDYNTVLETLLECGHSRVPVRGESADDILGLFYAKDILKITHEHNEGDFSLGDYIRSPFFVPESKKIDDLLTEFRTARVHMAIVVDEFGGTSGVVTLEDIIEEIFGEIHDEYDSEVAEMIIQIEPGRVRAEGKTDIWSVGEWFGVEFPDEDYESLAGFLLAEFGSVPQPGTELNWENLHFRVLDADEKRIISVEIEADSEAMEEVAS